METAGVMDMRLLRIREVIDLTGLSRMSIYRFEKRGEFPRRRQVGRNSVRWVDEDILVWISSRPQAAAALAQGSASS